MTDAAATIKRLYAALEAGDGEAMAACYSAEATFEDPAFGRLEGDQVGAMWRMLTSRSSGVRVDLREHEATGTTGSAHWVASYRFGPKQRPVVNDVHASYRFGPDGLITEHVDRFDLARWGSQAMGPVQGLLGRTALLSLLVRRTTARQLAAHDGTRR
ncbi:MAG: nuclear transport factor 2 family protein [Actinomycetota bacterium]|nr:nuclear transport factor 2 family protein [Actinomycetota bacterium]